MSFRFVLKGRDYQPVPFKIPKPEYTCHLNKQSFCGSCGIQACHANIGVEAHPSACLYLFYNNKKREFDKFDVMYALDLKEKSYRNLYQRGSQQTMILILFYRILQYLRDINKGYQCERCGIFKSSTQACRDQTTCQQRVRILTNVIQQSNFKYPEIKGRLQDLYLVLKNKYAIQEYLHKVDMDYKPNLETLLGISAELLTQLQRIPTEIGE